MAIIFLFRRLRVSSLETDQRNDEAYYLRGVEHYKQGMYDQAISDFNNTLEINRKHTEAYFYKAVVCEKVGRAREATEAYRDFIKKLLPSTHGM